MSLKASDIAKLSAGVAAGYFTASYVNSLIADGDDSTIESLLKSCTGLAAGGLASGITTTLMDKTGVSSLIDDVADETGVSDLIDDVTDWF